jgi:hypothetical protein
MTVIAASMKGGKVTVTFGTKMEPLAPAQAMRLAEEMARLAFVCIHGREPPTNRSVIAMEVRKRTKGEVREEIVATGVAGLCKSLEGGLTPERVIEEVVDLMLGRI